MTESELCEQMQKDGNCNSIDCKECHHMIQLILTTLKMLKDKM